MVGAVLLVLAVHLQGGDDTRDDGGEGEGEEDASQTETRSTWGRRATMTCRAWQPACFQAFAWCLFP